MITKEGAATPKEKKERVDIESVKGESWIKPNNLRNVFKRRRERLRGIV